MSQKSCSATGPASRHSSKQGEEAKKETQSPGTVSLFLCFVFRRLFVPHFISCLSTFAVLSFNAFPFRVLSLALHLSRFILCAVSFDALSLHFAFRALPFVLCLPCVIGRRRILQHFVPCTSPFALHFSVLCRLAPCLLHFVSQFLTFHIAPRVGHFPNRPFLSIIAFAATHLPCRLYKIMSTFHCEIRLCLFRAFGSPPGCARPSSGQGPLSL